MGNSARRALLALISRLRTTLEAGFSSSTDEPSPLALHWGLRYLACHALQLRGLIATESGASLRHLLSAARESFPAYFHTPPDFTVPAADAVQDCEELIASHLGPDTRIRRLLAGVNGLGWAYQAWSTSDRRRIQGDVRRTRGAKIESRSVVPATQLYTEGYMARFLADHAMLPAELGPDFTVCDPACGAGHLLIEAFDRLFDGWMQSCNSPIETDPEQTRERQICQWIFDRQLFGIDIDPQAVEVARFSLAMRAAERAPGFRGSPRNVICATADDAPHADELGSLLRPEDANVGSHLARLLSGQYDLVITNPPYVGPKYMGQRLKQFLREHHPTTRRDLCPSFIDRCFDLTKPGGRTAVVTMKSWLYQSAFAKFRRQTLTDLQWEVLADLGSHAFSPELGLHFGVSVALAVFRKQPPAPNHSTLVIRATAPDHPADKRKLLRSAAADAEHPARVQVTQRDLLAVPGAAFCYWLPGSIVHAFANGSTLKGQVKQGLATTSNQQFLRYEWELPRNAEGWVPCAKGGTYRKWCGLDFVRVDWRADGAAIKAAIPEKYPYLASWEWVAKNAGWYFRPGLTYSYMCYGSLSARVMRNAVFEVASIGVFPPPEDEWLLLAVLNCRTTSWILRAISQKHMFQAGMTENLPLPRIERAERERLETLVDACVELKRELLSRDPCEGVFDAAACERRFVRDLLDGSAASLLEEFELAARLHTAEGELERLVVAGYGLGDTEIASLLAETGVPAGWRPQIEGTFSDAVCDAVHRLFAAGSEVLPDPTEPAGPETPVPTETWLEAISGRLKIHPESVLRILQQGITAKHWKSPGEHQRRIADGLSVIVLRLLGRSWPGESARDSCPDIIPLTAGTGMPTLADRLHHRVFNLAEGSESAISVQEWRDRLATALGSPLEDWLVHEFFRQHVRTFKRRPCVWQIQSQRRDPAFACVISLHAVDEWLCDRISDLARRALVDARDDSVRRELKQFLQSLATVRDSGFASDELEQIAAIERLDKWSAPRRGERAPASVAEFVELESVYDPDPLDGVRINIAPFQKWGLLAAPVLTAIDVEAAIAFRASRRADERRWSRRGHLPVPSAWGSDGTE